MQISRSHPHQAAREPHVASIRLTGGSSDDAVWVLEEGVGGTFLTIGSDPECEWQVRAAGVPAHALSVLLIGGLMYVRGGPQRGARLNGTLLNEAWQQVGSDARLDIGLASLEIKLGKDALLPSLKEVRVPPVQEREPPLARSKRRAPTAPERSGMRRSFVPERAAQRPLRVEARDSAREQRSEARSSGRARNMAEFERRRVSHRPRHRAASLGWLYLLATGALFGAYTLFVIWLD